MLTADSSVGDGSASFWETERAIPKQVALDVGEMRACASVAECAVSQS